MEKISELTEEQEQKVNEYRERFFGFATSTKPGNKELVSQAAVRLAEIAGLANCEVKFISNPKEGESVRESVRKSVRNSVRESLDDSLDDSVWNSVWNSLDGSLWKSLWNSLDDSLWKSLRGSLYDSVRFSTWDSFYDSGWTAFYSFVVEELGIECSDRDREILSLYRVIAENCSAIWVTPGTVIICDKPVSVEVKDGNLISAEWAREAHLEGSVSCRFCGTQTAFPGTKMCNNCWEVESRLGLFVRSEKGRDYVRKVLAKEEAKR